MHTSRRPSTPVETAQRLSRGEGEEVVVLEEGDPLVPVQVDAPDWDWDAEALSGECHCGACGAWGPVFELADGSRVCAGCAHGRTESAQTHALR
jgi:hypothetical protein